jgi:hypothetical protein
MLTTLKILATMLMGTTTIVGILDHLLGKTLMVDRHLMCPTTLMLEETLQEIRESVTSPHDKIAIVTYSA